MEIEYIFMKMHLRISSKNWRPICLSLNVLKNRPDFLCCFEQCHLVKNVLEILNSHRNIKYFCGQQCVCRWPITIMCSVGNSPLPCADDYDLSESMISHGWDRIYDGGSSWSIFDRGLMSRLCLDSIPINGVAGSRPHYMSLIQSD